MSEQFEFHLWRGMNFEIRSRYIEKAHFETELLHRQWFRQHCRKTRSRGRQACHRARRTFVPYIHREAGQHRHVSDSDDATRRVLWQTLARGTMARKLKLKRRAASQFRWWEMKLNGTKTRKIFKYDPKKKDLIESDQRGSFSAFMSEARRWLNVWGLWGEPLRSGVLSE